MPEPARGEGLHVRARTALGLAWDRFRPSILDRLAGIEAALDSGVTAQGERERLADDAHSLVGSLGAFGFPDESRTLRRVERLLADPPAPGTSEAARVAADLAKARRRLSTSPAGGRFPAPATATVAVREGCEPPLLLVGSPDRHWTAGVAAAAEEHGYRVRTSATLRQSRLAALRGRPDVALVDLSLARVAAPVLALAADLAAASRVIVAGRAPALGDRVEAARVGAAAFLTHPLPAGRVMDAVADALRPSRHQRGRARVPRASRVGDTVVVVDDNTPVRLWVAAALEPEGLTVVGTDKPDELWALLEAASPDVLLLDEHMPRATGREVCRALRADPRWAGLPVVLLTASDEAGMVEAALQAGADDVVAKPATVADLVHAVRAHLPPRNAGTATAATGSQ